jgi:flagellar basal body-associated protein FliL
MWIVIVVVALLALIGVLALIWYLTRNVDRSEEGREPKPWIDHSLDDWRKQRDAEAEADRIARAQERPKLHEGAAAEEQAIQKTHTRWGG